jgi:hypothetical protein
MPLSITKSERRVLIALACIIVFGLIGMAVL